MPQRTGALFVAVSGVFVLLEVTIGMVDARVKRGFQIFPFAPRNGCVYSCLNATGHHKE